MEFESESETGTGKMTDHEIICVSSIDGLKTYHMTDIAVAAGIFDGVHSGHVKLLTTLKTLAAELKLSPSHTSVLVKKLFGCSFTHLLQQLRVSEAGRCKV